MSLLLWLQDNERVAHCIHVIRKHVHVVDDLRRAISSWPTNFNGFRDTILAQTEDHAVILSAQPISLVAGAINLAQLCPAFILNTLGLQHNRRANTVVVAVSTHQ